MEAVQSGQASIFSFIYQVVGGLLRVSSSTLVGNTPPYKSNTDLNTVYPEKGMVVGWLTGESYINAPIDNPWGFLFSIKWNEDYRIQIFFPFNAEMNLLLYRRGNDLWKRIGTV